jgi:glutaminyl-peptide cyclotransferase
MMLDLAEALNPLLNARKRRLENGLEDDEDVSDTTLQLVFFDGEEAFVMWTSIDSVYGARCVLFSLLLRLTLSVRSRHLADKWANTYLLPHPKRRLLFPSGYTQLSTIEHLILLDLLGAPNPLVHSFFIDTAWLFDSLITTETRLRDSGALNFGGKNENNGWRSFFVPRTSVRANQAFVLDDHIPFLNRGVNILHIIPNPFPAVWHTLQVNRP